MLVKRNQTTKLIAFLIFFLLFTTIISGVDLKNVEFIGIFEEWDATSEVSKPDQIRVDPFNEEIIWFTQPAIHGIARFNYKTKVLTEFSANGSYRPDGLVIDDSGVLWFGEQSAGTLGKFNPETEEFTHYKVPYKGANPALPFVDHQGFIWVSDHLNGKIIRFNPEEEKFVVINVPTPNSWVVDLKADSKNQIWYSCYESNKIGVIDVERKTMKEYTLPNATSGPAFLAVDSKDHIWFTQWKSNKIGKFIPEEEKFVEYQLPLPKPGPATLTIGADDVIYFSTKFLNAIVMFDPDNDEEYFYTFSIPTPESGQKDGLAIDENGIIWFTEFDKNKFGRLQIVFGSDVPLPGESKKNRTLKAVNRLKAIKASDSYTNKEIHSVSFAELIED